jgi:hypothetical protein
LGEVASKIKKKNGEDQQPNAGPGATLLNHCVRSRLSPARPVKPKTILMDL